MGKHAHATQKWAYSAEQMAAALTNPDQSRYKQGLLDALRSISLLEAGELRTATMQELLDSLPNTWDQTIESAYVTGFEDMYGVMAETLSMEYAPEIDAQLRPAAKLPKSKEPVPIKTSGEDPVVPAAFSVFRRPKKRPLSK